MHHPEGDSYFVHDEKRIVTACDVRDPAISAWVLQASELLRRKLYDKSRDRLAQSEVFLEVVIGQSAAKQVRYYWADHSTCSVFWLDDVAYGSLGLPALHSMGELSEFFGFHPSVKLNNLKCRLLESRLTPEYWTHVEYHPMHLTARLEAEDLLVGILAHGCVGELVAQSLTAFGINPPPVKTT